MSKIENKIKKKINKNYVDINNKKAKNELTYFFEIIGGIIVVIALTYFSANLISGNYKKEEETKDYSNIVAGQTFTRNDDIYYVVFYDNDEILETINTIEEHIIYKVDLNSSLNKSVISNEGNNSASDAADLKINGTTIIKIENGKNVSYVEGYEATVKYLESLKWY